MIVGRLNQLVIRAMTDNMYLLRLSKTQSYQTITSNVLSPQRSARRDENLAGRREIKTQLRRLRADVPMMYDNHDRLEEHSTLPSLVRMVKILRCTSRLHVNCSNDKWDYISIGQIAPRACNFEDNRSNVHRDRPSTTCNIALQAQLVA